MHFEDVKLDFKDVLILPRNTDMQSRCEVSLERTFQFKYYPNKLTCVPIIASNMSTVGTVSMANALAAFKMLTVLHKYVTDFENVSREFTFISCGITDVERVRKCIVEHGFDKICIDVANGYMNELTRVISLFRTEFPHLLIMAGNVVTAERSIELIHAGADIVKCGIGSGSACLTRMKTGVGYPQLSCVMDSCLQIQNAGGLMVSDGGCSCPADICKAFGAGADFVMLGGMLGCHSESECEIIDSDSKPKMAMYGMSSKTAQEKFNGGMNEYRSSEGRSLFLDYRGPVKDTVMDILGGLRSCGTYIDAKNIDEFKTNANFIRVNQQINNPYDR